jgi:hypothetical protein
MRKKRTGVPRSWLADEIETWPGVIAESWRDGRSYVIDLTVGQSFGDDTTLPSPRRANKSAGAAVVSHGDLAGFSVIR